MKICIIGTGYVGLVTGACFAEMSNLVWCIDHDQEKINQLKSGVVPIYEPGLKELVEKNSQEGRLYFTTDIQTGLEQALFCFIAVGTPQSADGSADLSYIFNVAHEIGQCMNEYLIIVVKSTVPVGTIEKVKDIVKSELQARGKEGLSFDVASNPEFLKEGTAVEDFMAPDRIVIGTDNEETAQLMKQLYQTVLHRQDRILNMDIKSAEITKYAANVMLATRISFMNEIARLCDKVGGDIDQIRVGIGTDERIGNQFLYAGAGYGGSCFPKDVKEFIHTGQKNGLEMNIADAVHKVNERQKFVLVDMIKKRFGENLLGKKIGIWGLAFKAQTDDMREAPSLVILPSLIQMGARIIAYDPEAMEQAKLYFREYFLQIEYVDSMMEAVNQVDALVLITEWQQFKQADFAEIKQSMKQPLIFDGRNQYDPMHMKNLGFEYYCIGRNGYGK
ncbi:UDP-glucose dehydrogenase family protein [Pelosinus sp. sgz500959]|uniref:UDP-glucose dehydrogenase family protein n=1 Tax=Pelosinus sp. sgz500959 TaxID=3242472 RepID=UPI00366B364A